MEWSGAGKVRGAEEALKGVGAEKGGLRVSGREEGK